MQSLEDVQDVGALCLHIDACTQCVNGTGAATVDMNSKRMLLMHTSNCTVTEQKKWASAEVWLQQADAVTTESVSRGLFHTGVAANNEVNERCLP